MKRTAERTGKGCFGSPFLLTISWRADDNAPAMHLFVALSIVTASMGAARPDVSVVPRPSVASFVAGAAEQVKHCYRSEEHTSELQSLMRISYAVFCLKKKKQKYTQNNNN